VLRWVKNLDNFDFFMITKVSSTYRFCKRGESAKVPQVRVLTFSITELATTDETGKHIAV